MSSIELEWGPIAFIALPGWEPAPPSHLPTMYTSIRGFRRPDHPQASLEFLRWGRRPLPPREQFHFARFLQAAPCQLSRDDLWELVAIVYDMANPEYFDLSSARTEHWNGRAVLLLEGRWKTADVEVFDLFFAGDNPEGFERISFRAPAETFARIRADVQKAFRSIEWRRRRCGSTRWRWLRRLCRGWCGTGPRPPG